MIGVLGPGKTCRRCDPVPRKRIFFKTTQSCYLRSLRTDFAKVTLVSNVTEPEMNKQTCEQLLEE